MTENRNFTSMRNDPKNIFELQRALNYIARFVSEIPAVNPDGIYGAETKAAVSGFQNLHGIEPTGEADFETWTAVFDVYRAKQRKNGTPKPVHVFPHTIASMKEGDSFDEVYVLQVMLRRLSRIYTNIGDAEINGVFDSSTKRAVNDIKGSCGMEQNGEADREFWNIVADTYSAFTFND